MRRCLPLACLACALAVGLSSGASAARGPGLIVYWSESPFPSIWSIRPDGTHRRRILRNGQNAKRPRLSPDRRWVAFDGAPRGKPPLSDFDVQVVRLDGTGLRSLTHGSMWDVDAQWSPDGSELSFSRLPPKAADEHRASIWIVRRDGSGLRRLTRGFGARWSPDGRRLVYEMPRGGGTADLALVGSDGRDPRPLVTAAGVEQPAGWSPDGRQILFTRFDPAGRASVFVVDADGTHTRRLASGIAAAWSPDGTQVLYGSDFSSDLLVMNRDGSHKRTIARVAASEPDWR